jgi:hypothetical protein
MNSPTVPVNITNGIKDAIMVMVAPKTGINKSEALRHAAVHLSTPASSNST